MRGIDSIANAVTPAPASASSTSARVRGARKPTSTESPVSLAISSGLGGETFTTTSEPHGAPIGAPASANAASGSIARSPAPDSTTTSRSRATSLRITSGTSPTRRSPSPLSFGTPTGMLPGTVPDSAGGDRDAAIVVHGERVARRQRRLVERPDGGLDARVVGSGDEPDGIAEVDLRGRHEAGAGAERVGRGALGVEHVKALAVCAEAGPDAARLRAAVDAPDRLVALGAQLAPGPHEDPDRVVVRADVDAAARGDDAQG